MIDIIPSKKKDKNQKIQIQLGEYTLHILIQQTTQIQQPITNSTMDIIITVQSFGIKQFSKIKKSIGYEENFWGDHFYFTKQFKNKRQFEEQKIKISIFNHNLILADNLIGNCEFDLIRIYLDQRNKEPFKHRWVALSNIQKNFKQVTAYLKLSISCVSQQDPNIQLKPQSISTVLNNKHSLLPPNIQRQSYQLSAKLYRGKYIKPADGETVDSYLSIGFGPIYHTNEAKQKQNNPQYNSVVKIPVTLPSYSQNITLRLYDKNVLLKDELLGTYIIKLNEIKNKKKYSQPTWIHFYGPQLKSDENEMKKIYAKIPQLSAYYCGSVLLSLNLIKKYNPKKERNQIRQHLPPPKFKYYMLIVNIFDAVNLQMETKYQILCRFGNQIQKTEFALAKHGWAQWYEQINIQYTWFQNSSLPDFFIYLVDNNQNKICFLRFPSNVPSKQDKQYYEFIPDVTIKQKQETGLLKISYVLNEIPQLKKSTEFKTKIKIDLPKTKKKKLLCQLYSAHSLSAKDIEGTSDPFFILSYKNNQVQSRTIQKTLNPIYYENLELLNVMVPQDPQDSPPIIINVYDKDALTRQFIGKLSVEISKELKQKQTAIDYYGKGVHKPKYFKIKDQKIDTGQALLSFRFVDLQDKSYFPRYMSVPTKRYKIQIFILGIRNLKSIGLFPINQPLLEFDLDSLNPYGKQSHIKNQQVVLSQKKQKINITCQLDLPINRDFWPPLSVRVKNQILKQFYIQYIGFFSIDLRKSQIKTIKQFKESIQLQKRNRQIRAIYMKSKIYPEKNRLDGINKDIIEKFKLVLQKACLYRWKLIDKKTIKNENSKINKNIQSFIHRNIVLYPEYKLNNQNSIYQVYKQDIQTKSEYMIIGSDIRENRLNLDFEQRNRHYRFVYNGTYQQYYKSIMGFDLGFFEQIQIRTGKKLVEDDFVTKFLKKVNTEDTYIGTYKGNCLVTEIHENQDKQLQEIHEAVINKYKKKIASQQHFLLYIYIIEACNLKFKKNSYDSYLSVKLGTYKFDTKQKYIKNSVNPKYYEKIKCKGSIPKQSYLIIEIWDKNIFLQDTLIGSVNIDIQNRLQQLDDARSINNFIQTHQLKCETSKINQGILKFWIDIVTQQYVGNYKEFNISTQQKQLFQLRLIIYGCYNMPIIDFSKLADYYVVVQFGDQRKQTDTHNRASSIASFNWRMVFLLQLPTQIEILTFKIYDKAFLGSDNFIASCNFSIAKYLTQSYQNNKPLQLFLGDEDLTLTKDVDSTQTKIVNGMKMYNVFNLNLKCSDKFFNLGFEDPHITIQLAILPIQQARKNPVGNGRSEPNQNPKLQQPKGRKSWTLNPFAFLSQLFGQNAKYEIMCILCLVIFGIVLYDVAFSSAGTLVGLILHKI